MPYHRALPIVALLGALVAQTVGAQARKKQVKDQGEHDLYVRAINADDPGAQIAALDIWVQRYPDSEYKHDRLYMYMQAYNKLNPPQPLKVIEHGARLISANLQTLFNAPEGGLVIVNVLFLVARNVASLPAPTSEQLALGEKAARDLLKFLGEHEPGNTPEPVWGAAREDIGKRTQAALIVIALAPGNQAMAKEPPDCAAAVTAWSKALADYPGSALIAYNLGKAYSCQGSMPRAIYLFVRAAELDPSLGDNADPRQIANYAARLYTTYHGGDDGFDQLRNQAKNAPIPPADFNIETADEVAARKQNEFAKNNPRLALWMGIKEQLSGTNAIQYFEGQLKNTAVLLKGTVVEGRPACRPKELLVAVDAVSRPEILLRLDSPPAGIAVPGEIEFDAISRLFSKDPFLVTMDVARLKITNLKIGPCPSR